MTKIFLIRHAEAEGNLFKRVHGQYDSPVTKRGREQIACLKKRFESVHIDAVYASDLLRTCQTAEAIYVPKELELCRMPTLREVHLGVWEDRTFGELIRLYGDKMAQFSTGDLEWMVEGGEKLGFVQNRIYQSLLQIAADNPDRTVAVFSHGTAIRLVLTKLLDLDYYCPEGMNTAVSTLIADENGITVLEYNDISHYSEELAKVSLHPKDVVDPTPKEEMLNGLLWFRPWDPNDEKEYYCKCRKEAWYCSHGTMDHYDQNIFYHAAVQHAQNNAGSVLVAMSNNKAVGLLELDFIKGADIGVGAICFYYLDPITRGHRVGAQLLGQAISTYKKLGRNALRLRCAPENSLAFHFYSKNGFYKIGMADDSVVPLYVLERKI